MTKIIEVSAVALTARFADLYGGADAIPATILRPASHFVGIPRTGQYSTLVRIATDDGLVGYGEAWGLPLPQASALWVERIIAPVLIGRDADDIDGVWRELVDYLARVGHSTGTAMEAVSGVDLALWDLRGRRAGKPVADLLGRRRTHIDCYASPVMFADDLSLTRAAARAFVEEGFDAIKIKAGRGVARDVDDVANVRDEVGPDVDILIDVNGAYDLDQAKRLADGLAVHDIAWLEEPMPPTRLSDMAALRRHSAIPIALGENEFTLAQFEHFLAGGCADIVMPNITRAGGFTGCLQIAAAAKAHGARFSLHGVGAGLMQSASLNLLASLEETPLFEVNRFPNPLREALTRPILELEKGRLAVPDGPGLGLAIQDEAVTRFAST